MLADDNPRELFVLSEQPELFQNGIVYFLALAFADNAIKGFNNVTQLLSMTIPANQRIFTLQWNEAVLNQSVFRMVKKHGVSERALSYSSLQPVMQSLGYRSGYPHSITPHAFRRAVGNAVDSMTLSTSHEIPD